MRRSASHRITGDSWLGGVDGAQHGFWRSYKRDGRRIRHSQKRLARILLLAGQSVSVRDDPAAAATSDRAGTAPMGKAGRLPSQPTLSRRVAAWSAKEGVEVLREGLQRRRGGG